MATRSPDVEALLHDVVAAVARGDAARMKALTSSDPATLVVGTDAAEWMVGRDEIMRLYTDSGPDGSLEIRVLLDDAVAYEEGDVGWAAGHAAFEFAGVRVPVRVTAVACREEGAWRLIQMHASVGVPNEELDNPLFRPAGAVGA